MVEPRSFSTEILVTGYVRERNQRNDKYFFPSFPPEPGRVKQEKWLAEPWPQDESASSASKMLDDLDGMRIYW